MKPVTKKILIVSTCCIAAGIILTGAGLAAGGFPGLQITASGIRSSSDEPEPYRLEKTQIDPFTDMEIVIDDGDLEILPSADGNCYLEYLLDGSGNEPDWEVSGGTFRFTQNTVSTGGIFLFGTDLPELLSNPRVRLYLPGDMQLTDAEITNRFGDVTAESLSSDSLQITVEFGDLEMKDCRSDDMELELDAGRLTASDTQSDSLVLVNEYGDSELKNMVIRTADFTIETGTLTLDASGIETLTGINEYGDTELSIRDDLTLYSIDLYNDYGDIAIPDTLPGRVSEHDLFEHSYQSAADSDRSISFQAEMGDIELIQDKSDI